MSLVKSEQRVADHGEVSTPAWLDEAMLDIVKEETERIDARFLDYEELSIRAGTVSTPWHPQVAIRNGAGAADCLL